MGGITEDEVLGPISVRVFLSISFLYGQIRRSHLLSNSSYLHLLSYPYVILYVSPCLDTLSVGGKTLHTLPFFFFGRQILYR